jgi:hypothetical protein
MLGLDPAAIGRSDRRHVLAGAPVREGHRPRGHGASLQELAERSMWKSATSMRIADPRRVRTIASAKDTPGFAVTSGSRVRSHQKAIGVHAPIACCERRDDRAARAKVAAIVPLERGRAAACRRMTSPGVQTVACPKALEAPQRDCSRPSRPKIASRPRPRSGPFRATRECAGRRVSGQSELARAHRRRLGRRTPDSNNGDQQVPAGQRMQERTWTSST